MEKHSVSKIIGAPPGYVGYDEAGQLTEKIRRRPYSVILFDEIEKAHPDVLNILLQVLDDGKITDAQGRLINFENTVIIMTSNAGASEIGKSQIGFGDNVQTDSVIDEQVAKIFTPEFRNRLDAIIPFNYLDKNVAKLVCQKEINKLAERLKKQKVDLFVTDNCIDYLTELGYSKEFGARNMTRVIEDKIANQLVDEVLFGKLEKGGKVTATLKDADIIFEIN
jgi:ATP-dependent Clp protease ATP-binding subunit ClpA